MAVGLPPATMQQMNSLQSQKALSSVDKKHHQHHHITSDLASSQILVPMMSRASSNNNPKAFKKNYSGTGLQDFAVP
jgi:hypothetical protein